MTAPTRELPTAPRLSVDDDSADAMYALMERHGGGDGLPLIPPTPARVEAMLTVGGGDPDSVIALLPPRSGAGTRRSLAVSAVMAGCRPEWLPVLVAAAQALARPEMNLRGVNATTHPVAPMLIVHGPAAAALGFNGGLGAFGPGNRANATVGRAVRLMLLHLAGATPGDGDASTQGQPAKYTFCVAENTAASPWGAYHHSVGVEEANAVTVHCGEGPHNFHDMESEKPAPILDKGATAMASLGMNNAPISQGEIFVGLCPEHAASLARHGWTRRDVQSYLFERARLPAHVFREAFRSALWRPWMRSLPDDALQPMTDHPDNFRVFVVGGAGKHSCFMPSWGVTKSQTIPFSLLEAAS